MTQSKEITSEDTQEEGAWLCEIYERASMQEEIIRVERMEIDDAYIPQPAIVGVKNCERREELINHKPTHTHK